MVMSMHFVVGPPTLCSLKLGKHDTLTTQLDSMYKMYRTYIYWCLGILDKRQSGIFVGRTRMFNLRYGLFLTGWMDELYRYLLSSFRYHDMDGVPNFLIPHEHFRRSALKLWNPGAVNTFLSYASRYKRRVFR